MLEAWRGQFLLSVVCSQQVGQEAEDWEQHLTCSWTVSIILTESWGRVSPPFEYSRSFRAYGKILEISVSLCCDRFPSSSRLPLGGCVSNGIANGTGMSSWFFSLIHFPSCPAASVRIYSLWSIQPSYTPSSCTLIIGSLGGSFNTVMIVLENCEYTSIHNCVIKEEILFLLLFILSKIILMSFWRGKWIQIFIYPTCYAFLQISALF